MVKKLSESELEQIGKDVGEATDIIFALRNLARHTRFAVSGNNVNEVDAGLAGIIALAEKAGFLADRCGDALGDINVCGQWEAWAGVEKSEAEEATA